MSEERCVRLDCEQEATATIALQQGEQEATTYHLCAWHYLECLTVIQGIRIVTGALTQEGSV